MASRRKTPEERAATQPRTSKHGKNAKPKVVEIDGDREPSPNPRALNPAAAAELRAQVFEARRQLKPWRTIAKELNIAISTAIEYWHDALEDLLPVETVEEWRRLELDRLEVIQRRVFAGALTPDGEGGELRYVSRYLDLVKTIASLNGATAPQVATTKVGVEATAGGGVTVVFTAPLPTNRG